MSISYYFILVPALQSSPPNLSTVFPELVITLTVYNHYSKDSINTCILSLNSPLHVSVEAQRSEVTCPQSHSLSSRGAGIYSRAQPPLPSPSLILFLFFGGGVSSFPFVNVVCPLSQHTVIS